MGKEKNEMANGVPQIDSDPDLTDVIEILNNGIQISPNQIRQGRDWNTKYVVITREGVDYRIEPTDSYNEVAIGPHNTEMVKCLLDAGYTVRGKNGRYAR